MILAMHSYVIYVQMNLAMFRWSTFSLGLINGLGRNPTNITSPLAVISVKYNKRYRLRLVSISCDPSFIFSIDNHNMVCINLLQKVYFSNNHHVDHY